MAVTVKELFSTTAPVCKMASDSWKRKLYKAVKRIHLLLLIEQ